MWTFTKFLIAGVVCYALIAAWLYFSQKRMLFYPRAEFVGTPDEIGLEYEDVTITNREGTQIHGWFVINRNARFLILFSHGNAGNVSHRLETIRILHDLGHSVFVYDYSGYGQSEGDPSEEAMYADARAVWDWIREQLIPAKAVVLFGRSLGGAVTARLAAELAEEGEQPAGMILESTFSSVPDMGSYMYPWLPVRQLSKYQFNSVEALQGVNLPTLFAHSEDDEIVPYDIGLRLYQSYNGPKEFLHLTGNHNYGYLDMGEAYINGIGDFLYKLEE